MAITVFLFIIGLVFLIKGGDWFVDGATGLAKRFHISEILIGATIVSIGTTLPEVMVSATSAFSGHGEIAYGNAIGSIICNTALVAAITITFRPVEVQRSSLKIPVIIFFAAAAVYVVVAYCFGEFTRITGMLFLVFFAVYIALSVHKAMNVPKAINDLHTDHADDSRGIVINTLMLVIGAGVIAFGADLLVDNGTIIAKSIGVPESVIALTFIAIGTSLPELVTAISSLAKGHSALSLGNVIGANILNLVLVSGVASIVSPFSIPNNAQIAGINSSLVVDIPVMLLVMTLLTFPAMIQEKLSRAQGVALLVIYIAFCIFQFVI